LPDVVFVAVRSQRCGNRTNYK